MEMRVARAQAQEIQKQLGIVDVPIVNIVERASDCGGVSCILIGSDDNHYYEVDTNVWMREGEQIDAAWVNTGKHGGGILLRPLYVAVEGKWINVANGRPAPEKLHLPAPSHEVCDTQDQENKSIEKSSDIMWRNRCKGLVRICEASMWAVDSDTVYQRMVDAVAEVFQCGQAHLSLMAADGKSFVSCARHFGEGDLTEGPFPEVRPATTGRFYLIKNAKVIVMDFANPHSEDQVPDQSEMQGYQWGVTFPLLAKETIYGACSVLFKTKFDYDEKRDEPFFLAVGKVLGSLIARVRATRKSMDLEILYERRRLGVEISSSLASLVSNLSVGIDSVLESYEEGNASAAKANLERLGKVTHLVIGAMRDELVSLRVPLDQTNGLVSAVEEALDRFQEQWGVETTLDVRSNNEVVVVPLQVSLQMIRILNECLSNVLSHADADHVAVLLEEGDRFLSLAVEDDGKGFDIQAVSPECMGLRVMKERAESIGGRLSVMSGEGGTAVCVDVPRVVTL